MRFGTKNLRRIAASCLVIGISTIGLAAAAPKSQLDPVVEKKITELLKKMTIEEKAGQMNQSGLGTADKWLISATGAGHIVNQQGGGFTAEECAKLNNHLQDLATKQSRMKIPVMMGGDCIVDSRSGESVTFAQPMAMGATFDPGIIQKAYRVMGKEQRAAGYSRTYAPNVGVARDPRMGRTGEVFGEDTYLVSKLSVAAVKGLMGDSLKTGVMATLKHYAAYDASIGGKDSSAMDISERMLREVYLPPFKAAIDAGAGAIMCAYHAVNGAPCVSNKWLLTDLLKNEMAFDGFVVTDYMCIESSYSGLRIAETLDAAAKRAFEAGLDVHDFDSGDDFASRLAGLVRKGYISEKTLDGCVRRILRAKFKAGLFDNPYADPAVAAKVVGTPENLAVGLQLARESMVLLKNEGNILPLKKDLKSVAVIGPNADNILYQLGVWTRYVAPKWEDRVVTVLEGIKNSVSPDTKVTYTKGCEVTNTLAPMSEAKLSAAISTGSESGFKAEYFSSKECEGTPVAVRVDKKIDFDWGGNPPAEGVTADYFSARWTTRFTPPVTGRYQFSADVDDGVRVFVDNKLVVDGWADHVGISSGETDLAAGRQYDLRVEYHESLGGAKIKFSVGTSALANAGIEEAVEAAKNADVAIVVVGDMPDLNGEGRDRADLNLTGAQDELVKAVQATGKPTVVVLINGRPLTINEIAKNVPAILEAWNPGEQGGTAVGEVLFGDYNPGGRLPLTFPRSVGQLPCYYNYEPGWHAGSYIDGTPASPLFSFGYGLSYTTFEYGTPKLSSDKMPMGGNVTVSVDVINTGARKGDEVVQMYIRDEYADVVRPIKELKGFQRITLDPGEKKTVSFAITPEELAYYNREMKRVVDPGVFSIMVGPNSVDLKTVNLEVVK